MCVGWMHHVFDETPEEARKLAFQAEAVSDISHATYDTNVGGTNPVEAREQHNTSQYRQRGFQVGSRMTGEKEKDFYYVQPGHALSPLADKGGRFKVTYTKLCVLRILYYTLQTEYVFSWLF